MFIIDYAQESSYPHVAILLAISLRASYFAFYVIDIYLIKIMKV